MIARCLEHAEGVEFSRGLSEADEPALWQHDLRGDLQAWIEVGSPSVDRLHKASKAAARVVVYTWKNQQALATDIVARGVHRRDKLILLALDPAFLDAVAATVDRKCSWDLAVSGGTLYLTVDGRLHESVVRRVPIP